MLAAAATVVSVSKEGSVPHVCVAPLLVKAGVDDEEVMGWGEFVESNYVMNSWRIEEDACLILHFDVPSAVKKIRVLEARSG